MVCRDDGNLSEPVLYGEAANVFRRGAEFQVGICEVADKSKREGALAIRQGEPWVTQIECWFVFYAVQNSHLATRRLHECYSDHHDHDHESS
jgi:hypothetical protein